jgi:hypothetical protein
MWRRVAVLVAIAAAAGGGFLAGRRTTAPGLPMARPGGYPVECRRFSDVCFQLGRRVAFTHGQLLLPGVVKACSYYAVEHGDNTGSYTWQTLGDSAPGAGATGDTFVCGPLGISLSTPNSS